MIELEMYAVRSKDGKWLRRKGYGGVGDSWVDDIKKARVYPKIGQARSQVTWWSTNYPKYGVPSIIKLNVASTEVVDESERVNKAIRKKKELMVARKIHSNQMEIERLQANIVESQKKLLRIRYDDGLVSEKKMSL